jgi:polyribonucleotide nucleotidyltransferase
MITKKIELFGKEYSLETGRFAKQASGSVMVKCNDTMVLVTAVAAETERDVDFLPLQCEYRIKTASAGKIPGGFLKREARPSDAEVLASRLIDRPIRPLIPKTWRFETQVIATVFSAEPEVEPDVLAMFGASAALMISDIPFNGPVSEVRIGKIDGEFVLNPSFEDLKNSEFDLSVAGTDTAITMVEGESKEISEELFLEALEFAHENIKKFNALQKELADSLDIKKREFEEHEPDEELVNLVKETIFDDLLTYVHTVTSKTERNEMRSKLLNAALEKAVEKYSADEDYDEEFINKEIAAIFKKLEKAEMRKMILEESKRLDGRGLTEIRPITVEVGLLPRAHGSALFTRGETQSLTTVTLGTAKEEQMIDGLQPTYTNPFYLHYNFPPYSTGEVGRLMTGRREIGHGNLAERALKIMAPAHEDFPYTIRVVSDILESNGSSSMATVCAGSLALFDAGVPMKKAVAGIAMGLIKEEDNVAVLSDILGDEDFLGDMDFKVTGTADGITACQMDIKIEGLSWDILRTALQQAKDGRMHILGIMNDLIDAPRQDVSRYAPRFITMSIPQEKIGAVIGSGGETIRGIVKETTAEVDIKDDGTVIIASVNREDGEKAREIIESIIKDPVDGEDYTGVVKEIKEGIGAIIEFMPKKQGLLHISQISHERVENVEDVLHVGDVVEVKLIEATRDGKFRLSRKVLLPKPEGMSEEEYQRSQERSMEKRDNRRSNNRRYDDRRGGDRRGGDRRGGSGRDRGNSRNYNH